MDHVVADTTSASAVYAIRAGVTRSRGDPGVTADAGRGGFE
jgi:hypothetical protein